MKLPPNQNQPVKLKKASSHLEQINHNAAGIDLGGAEHWVCVPSDRAENNVRRFGCFTPDLMAMVDWLIECKVTTIAILNEIRTNGTFVLMLGSLPIIKNLIFLRCMSTYPVYNSFRIAI
jgi:hypothetical protein